MKDSDDIKNTVDTAVKRANEFISLKQDGEAIKVLQVLIKNYTPQTDCFEVTPILDFLGTFARRIWRYERSSALLFQIASSKTKDVWLCFSRIGGCIYESCVLRY